MKKSKLCLSLASGVLALSLCTVAPAQAQTETSPPPVAASSRSSAYSGGGAGLGVGATAWLSGLAGAEVVYDQAIWDIDGTLGFRSANQGPGVRRTDVVVGVSAWYHLLRGVNSDLSLGGGIGFASLSAAGNGSQAFAIEPAAQVRVFITPNVAVHARAGLAMIFGDDGTVFGQSSSVALGGQVGGSVGFTYFIR